MPTRLLAPKNVILSEISSHLNENNNESKIWLETFEQAKKNFTPESIVEELMNPKYSNGRGLIKKWDVEIEKLPITKLYPDIITDPRYYDSNAFINHITRSAQSFFKPHFVVTVLHSRNREFALKFSVNINPRKFITKNVDKVQYLIYTNFKTQNARLEEILYWWSKRTETEVNLLNRSTNDLKNDSICAVFALVNNRIVGAGGIKKHVVESGAIANFKQRQLVELFGVYVDNEFREYNIASTLVHMRLEFCRNNNFFPIAVTKNKLMDLVYKDIAKLVEDMPEEYLIIPSMVRDCTCDSIQAVNCKVCPYNERSFWVFNNFID